MNKHKEDGIPGKKNLWRYLFGAAAVLSGLWLILYAILRRFGLLLNTLKWSFSPNKAASIGIIGGADGPTAIFVAGNTGGNPTWDVMLVVLILIGSIYGFIRLGKSKQK